MQQIYSNLYFPILNLLRELKTNGQIVQTEKWQGTEKPPPMLELMHVGFSAQMPSNYNYLVNQTGLDNANRAWADAHFAERVGEEPLNPGEAYKIWPWYGNHQSSNAKYQKGEKFSHTYMERFWPKKAGEVFLTNNSKSILTSRNEISLVNSGIRYGYGDLKDVLKLLSREPFTRQAYLPIFFPEDTGAVHGGRIPCTLGYHFMLRDGQFHIHYSIRACDALRHFRNDIYLTVRLLYYVLDYLKRIGNPFWTNAQPGIFTFSCMSFHVFQSEKNLI